MRPLIGITCDTNDVQADPRKYQSAMRYSRAVADGGGLPVLLPHEVELVDEYLARCDGFLLTGGDDLDMTAYGEPVHEQANLIDPRRQAFEAALLRQLKQVRPQVPCLGICLGMQTMAMEAGGRMDQYLPGTLGEEAAAVHRKDHRHGVTFLLRDSVLSPTHAEAGEVVSAHRQAVTDAGALRVVAKAPDGVIEAVDDPARPFYLGVQWHPERGDDSPLNRGLIAALVAAAGESIRSTRGH